jgi:hypothetical protein
MSTGKITLALIALAVPGFSSVVYQNTTTDTNQTYSYSVNAVTQFGDQISLIGTERAATYALVQLFNQGSAGTADITLRLFNIGSPVGTQIGPDFVNNGVLLPALDVVNVGFNLPDVTVPDNLIFLVSFANQGPGVDILGLDLFEPPTVGFSDNTFAIGYDGAYVVKATSGMNVFFELDANAPEPSTVVLVGAAAALLMLKRRRMV